MVEGRQVDTEIMKSNKEVTSKGKRRGRSGGSKE
jgi:hypothetical protein